MSVHDANWVLVLNADSPSLKFALYDVGLSPSSLTTRFTKSV